MPPARSHSALAAAPAGQDDALNETDRTRILGPKLVKTLVDRLDRRPRCLSNRTPAVVGV